MHRHGYKGRKLSLEKGPRTALVRGMLTSLVMHEAMTTTEAKAKEVAPRFEKLVTKAKKGDLHSQRQLRGVLLTEVAAQKLCYELAPLWADRQGGYTRIVKLANRRGDNAPLVRLQLVLPEKPAATEPAKDAKAETKPASKPAAKKPAAKTATKAAAKKTDAPSEKVEA